MICRARALRNALAAVGAILAALCAAAAFAQGFPERPIKVIVPFPPGGTVDALMRFLGPQVSESTGQPVLIENRAGGASFVGMLACAKSPPDGYTVCTTTPDSLTYSTFLYTEVPYDVENDFAGVTNLVITSTVLYTGAQSPYASFKDVIAAEKAKPGTLNFATWGPGTAPDLYARYINRELGLKIVQVPYKGAAPALTAAMAGEVQISFFSVGSVLPYIRSGKVKPLVATGAKRSPFLPDVPSLAEFGIDPGIVSYFAMYAPARTPPAILGRLNAEFVKALRSPVSEKFLVTQTLEPVGSSQADFAKFMKSDRENAGRLIRGLGIKPQGVPN
jgi:tripartite-type tricarboxylate transporter receptor subunit TctC